MSAPASRLRRGRAARRGAITLEYALILPVFIALVVGTMDVSWLFWQRTAMQVALQEGCRVGSLQDPGANFVALDSVREEARQAVLSRLGGLGVECRDCDAVVELVTPGGVQSLDCSMVRTSVSLTGAMPEVVMVSEVLTQMEVQR